MGKKKHTRKQRRAVLPPGDLPAVRVALAGRDGGPRCRYCLWQPPVLSMLQVDHVHPACDGGTNDLENLVLACATCNLSKKGRTLHEWYAYLSRSDWPVTFFCGLLDMVFMGWDPQPVTLQERPSSAAFLSSLPDRALTWGELQALARGTCAAGSGLSDTLQARGWTRYRCEDENEADWRGGWSWWLPPGWSW